MQIQFIYQLPAENHKYRFEGVMFDVFATLHEDDIVTFSCPDMMQYPINDLDACIYDVMIEIKKKIEKKKREIEGEEIIWTALLSEDKGIDRAMWAIGIICFMLIVLL